MVANSNLYSYIARYCNHFNLVNGCVADSGKFPLRHILVLYDCVIGYPFKSATSVYVYGNYVYNDEANGTLDITITCYNGCYTCGILRDT